MDLGVRDIYPFNVLVRPKNGHAHGHALYACEAINEHDDELPDNVATFDAKAHTAADLDQIQVPFDIALDAEMLENLCARNVLGFLGDMRALLQGDGIAIMSCPVETGLVLVFKSTLRRVTGKVHGKISLRMAVRCILGHPIHRGDQARAGPHAGLWDRRLACLVRASGFETVEPNCPPPPVFGSGVNARALVVRGPRKGSGQTA